MWRERCLRGADCVPWSICTADRISYLVEKIDGGLEWDSHVYIYSFIQGLDTYPEGGERCPWNRVSSSIGAQDNPQDVYQVTAYGHGRTYLAIPVGTWKLLWSRAPQRGVRSYAIYNNQGVTCEHDETPRRVSKPFAPDLKDTIKKIIQAHTNCVFEECDRYKRSIRSIENTFDMLSERTTRRLRRYTYHVNILKKGIHGI